MVNFKNLKKGDVLSETQFYTVEKLTSEKVQFKTDNNTPVVLDKGYVESLLVSADQFDSVEKVTRTELAELLVKSSMVAITVNFNKQVDAKDVLAEILDAHKNTAPKDVEKEFKKAIKKALEGEERTIVGRHGGHVNEFGRLSFVDMQIERNLAKPEYDNRLRQVDPRTVNWLILRGVKYQVK